MSGRIDVAEANGVLSSQPNLTILVDQVATTTDEQGNYVRVLHPGRHLIQAGGVGFVNHQISSLQVEHGDSTRIDFHLRVDTQSTVN